MTRTPAPSSSVTSAQSGPAAPTPPLAPRPAVTLHRLRALHAAREPITMLTCYDATFAGVLDRAGVDCLLVGDSLGMVLHGEPGTQAVTLADMAYHTRCVAKARGAAFLVADLPFGSYEASPSQALASAAVLVAAGAQMVKLEGGGWTAETVRFLAQRGIPVCAHLGLTPQSAHALGGYRIQGRDAGAAAVLQHHAEELADAGAAMLVLELMPSAVASAITEAIAIPTIGIGAGPGCSGQVLVLHDMLGLGRHRQPRFVRDFLAGAGSVDVAVANYVAEVKARRFPDDTLHGY